MFWPEAGFLKRFGPEKYDEAKGISWAWLSGDGCMTKAPLAQETAPRGETNRYYISNADMSAFEFYQQFGGHWSIESQPFRKVNAVANHYPIAGNYGII